MDSVYCFSPIIDDFSLTSTWTTVADPVPGMTTPTTATMTKTFDMSMMPFPGFFLMATVGGTQGSPFTGAAINDVSVEGGPYRMLSSGQADITEDLAAAHALGKTSIKATFRFKASGTTSPPLGARSSVLTYTGFRMLALMEVRETMRIKIGGVWKRGELWRKVNGVWKRSDGDVKFKVNGAWKWSTY
jgi:hypothetical protein